MSLDTESGSQAGADILYHIERCLPKDHGYWATLLEYIETGYLRQRPEVIAATIAKIMEQDAAYDGLSEDSPDEFSQALIRIPYRRLRSWGDPEDIESPVGFYREQSSCPQFDPDYFLIYVPCTFSPPARLAYGPEVCTLYALAKNAQLDISGYYQAAAARFAAVSPSGLPARTHGSRLIRLVEKFKQTLALFIRLSNSQHFYEEGIRFYHHPEKGVSYTTSTTPGLLLPKEYYGSVYFPGITKLVPPGRIHDAFSLGNPGSSAFFAWRYLLREQLHHHPEDAIAKNPFRLAYFENGFLPAKRANYLIIGDSAQAALRRSLLKWQNQGLGNEYVEDIVLLVSTYLGNVDDPRQVASIGCLQTMPTDVDLSRLTLMSRGFCLSSERDRDKRAITHGRAINWSAAPLLAAITTTMIGTGVDMAQAALALGLPISLLAGVAVDRISDRVLTRFHQHVLGQSDQFQQSTPLWKLIRGRNGRASPERVVRKWIEDDCRLSFP